jgi:hypothetical protein
VVSVWQGNWERILVRRYGGGKRVARELGENLSEEVWWW